MKKLNIAELLKDCPKGMELDCTIWNNCTYYGIEDVGYINILIKTPCGVIKLSKEGCFSHNCCDAKCIIFPKGKTTWEGFQKPFKDGDILTTDLGSVFILKEPNKNIFSYGCYVALNDVSRIVVNNTQFCVKKGCRIATEEEKEKLFDAIKANGYKWNPETKTLEKLIKPKFKVGDRIKSKYINKDNYVDEYTIRKVYDECYKTDCGTMPFKYQDNWELVPNKFDITILEPFDKVLVRHGDNIWHIQFFEQYDKRLKCPFVCMNNNCYKQCIPYENNKHLFNTTNDCDDFYKTWE